MKKKTKTTTATKVAAHTARTTELRQILEDRRREIVNQVTSKMKDVRVEGAGGIMQPVEMGDLSDASVQDDIDFALIQMKGETLQRIDEALRRLGEGTYGNCFECGDEISEQRLRALPFAVRCKDCEEAREVAAERERFYSSRRPGGSLFLDLSS